MEFFMAWFNNAWIVILSALLLGASFLWCRRSNNKSSSILTLPPGPPAWPILGHLHLLGRLPHQTIAFLSSQYGALMHLRLGSHPLIVASSPEMAKEFLKTHDDNFANRISTVVIDCLSYGGKDLASAPYGQFYVYVRRICMNEMFNSKRIRSFQDMRAEELLNLSRSIGQSVKKGAAIHVRRELTAFTNNHVCRMTLGKPYSGVENIDSLMTESFYLCGAFNVGDYMSYLKWLDLQGYHSRALKLREKVDVFFSTLLEEHRQERSENPARTQPRDLMDALISASESRNTEIELDDENIKAIVFDMFGAGSDTSATTIEWALAELLMNFDVMEKLQEELDRVVGRQRNVEESDIANLRYLNAVVKETLRLHSPTPFLLPRRPTRACKIAGYDIPANAHVFVNIWAIQRDPSVWKDPLRFHPERHLSVSQDARMIDGHDFRLLSFGSGRRICPGMALGWLLVSLGIATLVHAFEWSMPADGTSPLKMDEAFGVTLRMAEPLLAVAKYRLSPEILYKSI